MRSRITGAPYDAHSRDGAVRVVGFGEYYGNEKGVDWTFRNLQKPEDVLNNSPLARYLPSIAAELGIQTLLVPSPVEFNGKIISADELTTRIGFEGALTVYRNKDKPADGLLLKPGQGFAVSAGGCAVLQGKCIDPSSQEVVRMGVAHAGFRSILNNVGGNLFAALDCDPKDARFRVEFAIDSELFTYPWDHPEYGKQNREQCTELAREFGYAAVPGFGNERAREGCISITAMLYAQLIKIGVPPSNITSGYHVTQGGLFYTTRDADPARRQKRNLFLVVRYK